MKSFSRRSLLEFMASLPIFATVSCASSGGNTPTARESAVPSAEAIGTAKQLKPGRLSVVQGPTSKTETLINILSPRLKKYAITVEDSAGAKQNVTPYQTVEGPTFYKVDKLKISNMKLGEVYTLRIIDSYKGRETQIDERQFSALDTDKVSPRFALLSCMSDDARFDQVIDPMWARLEAENPDFVILNGDTVYVDSFEFVQREKATEYDLWQRYVDSFRRIPLYHWRKLKPIFANWDDHDYGTNDSDRTFQSKAHVTKLFHAIFGGQALPGVWQHGPHGISSELTAFGQRFFFMDDRSFRQPNKDQKTKEPYGHWGKEQHDWLFAKLKSANTPAWILNGGQFFNGKAMDIKEVFEGNHPAHFAKFIEQLKSIKAPVIFASGDIHFSEINRIGRERFGYETYELTSSAMHSYYNSGWNNPLRMEGAFTHESNFMLIDSAVNAGRLNVQVKSIGLEKNPYFSKTLSIQGT